MKSKEEQVKAIQKILSRPDKHKLDEYYPKIKAVLDWYEDNRPKNFSIKMFEDMFLLVRRGKTLSFKQRHAVDNVLKGFGID